MTNEPEPRPPTSQPNIDNSIVTELAAIRQEVRELKEEVIGLRADLKNKILPGISGQVAIGIIQGFLLLSVLGIFIQLR
jgi:hypothetical protein